VAFNVLGLISAAFTGLFFFRGSRLSHMWRLAVPVCVPCKAAGRPRTLFVDDGAERVGFVVHERFAAEYRALNPRD
jgi:hypothetical protein